MTVDANSSEVTGAPETAEARDLPVAVAMPAPGDAAAARGFKLDPRAVLVGAGVALIGVAVLAVFLWMVPTAAARELQAACRGLKDEQQLYPQLCPDGKSCSGPQVAPDFTAQDMTGKVVHLSDLRGKVVLVNFWASWCGVCKTEKPALNQMAGDFANRDDFVVVALASDHTWADALGGVLDSIAPQAAPQGEPDQAKMSAAYRQAFPSGTPFKLWLDPPAGDGNIGKIATSWGIKAVPESALIDRKGNLVRYFVNKRDWQSPVAETCLRSVMDDKSN